MPDYPEIFVLRHGQTVWNAEGRHQGQQDSCLTILGREQAAIQGQILADAGAGESRYVYASPQGRAWSTAEIALQPLGKTAVPDDRLKEVSFGEWEGLTAFDIDARWPDNRAAADRFLWHFTAPGGERFEHLRMRAKSFLQDLTGPSIVVTHGITSRVLRGLWLGLDIHGMADIEGGQGVVYHLADGRQTRLDPAP
jgi:broad specificity phosphatase PhoE